MPRSVPLRLLESRRHELRLHFLPRRFSKLGVYSDTQRHLAGAFRIFFNAELEHYFESLAKLVGKEAEREWLADRTNRACAALVSGHDNNISMPQEVTQIAGLSFLDRKFQKHLTAVRKRINDNNGAKSHNILSMFLPLGIDETSLDLSLLAECDTLGSGRGLLAHKTAGAATYLIDPRTEFDQAKKIVKLLEPFEKILDF